MKTETRSVLYVRLPCWKIYPGGVIYVADYIHKQRPDIDQHLLDLALVPPSGQKARSQATPAGNADRTWSRSPGATCSPSARTRKMMPSTWS